MQMTESPKLRANDGLASTQFDSHTSCEPHGQGLAPTFLWGGERRQGGSRAPRTAWSRWVSGAIRFAASREKPGAMRCCGTRRWRRN